MLRQGGERMVRGRGRGPRRKLRLPHARRDRTAGDRGPGDRPTDRSTYRLTDDDAEYKSVSRPVGAANTESVCISVSVAKRRAHDAGSEHQVRQVVRDQGRIALYA